MLMLRQLESMSTRKILYFQPFSDSVSRRFSEHRAGLIILATLTAIMITTFCLVIVVYTMDHILVILYTETAMNNVFEHADVYVNVWLPLTSPVF